MDLVVDAHVHLWDFSLYDYQWPTPDMSRIYKTFLHKDLWKEMQATPVTKAIHVQVGQSLEETDWMLESAMKNDFIVGVVGWVDLTDPQLDNILERYCKNKKFVGCRHIVEAELDDEWLIQDEVQRGLGFLEARNLTYDLLLRPRHLKLATEMVKKFPNLTFILDHIAKPPIKEVKDGTQSRKQWMEDISELAKNTNVFCKLSSLITQADLENWAVEDLRPFVQEYGAGGSGKAIAPPLSFEEFLFSENFPNEQEIKIPTKIHSIHEFGVDRCMFGSDWPVAYLAKVDSYKTIYDTLLELLSDLTVGEKAKILGRNAVKIYKLIN